MFVDLDGTLADSILVMRTAYERFLELYNVSPTRGEFDQLNGPPLSEVVRLLRRTHSLNVEESELQSTYTRILDELYDVIRPSLGAVDLLQKATINRCIVGVVTSNSAQRTHRWLKRTCLSHYIDFVVSGDDIKCGKPHPEAYLEACQRARRPSVEAIAIEDSPLGARSAIDAGLRTFVVTSSSSSTIWPHGVLPVASLSELATLLW
jgi:beta-phosphoglucomutase